MHIVLLGDSIFDNAAYVDGGTAVIEHLRRLLPAPSTATLLAVDGSCIENVGSQLLKLPGETTHLGVSVGGNDALGCLSVFEGRVSSVAEAISKLTEVISGFRYQYRRMLRSLINTHLPCAVCTIYFPCFHEERMQQLAVTALALFNDCILFEAIKAGDPVIDLRQVCDSPSDYANPIEPSDAGGAKIAQSIFPLCAVMILEV